MMDESGAERRIDPLYRKRYPGIAVLVRGGGSGNALPGGRADPSAARRLENHAGRDAARSRFLFVELR